MPKVPTAQERSRQNMQNPTGLPSNQVANPVGQLGRGLENLGKNLEKIQKQKDRAERTLEVKRGQGLIEEKLLELESNVTQGAHGKLSEVEYINQEMDKFQQQMLKDFDPKYHRDIGVAGQFSINKTMATVRKIGRGRQTERIMYQINKHIDDSIKKVGLSPEQYNIELQKTTELVAQVMKDELGQNKVVTAQELNRISKRIILAGAQGYAEKGDIEAALAHVDKFPKYINDPLERQKIKQELSKVAMSKIKFDNYQETQERLETERQIAENRNIILSDLYRKIKLAGMPGTPDYKGNMAIINKTIAENVNNKTFRASDVSSLFSAIKTDRKDKSHLAEVEMAIAYNKGASPHEMIQLLAKNAIGLGPEKHTKWLNTIFSRKNERKDNIKWGIAKSQVKYRMRSLIDPFLKGISEVDQDNQTEIMLSDAYRTMDILHRSGLVKDEYEAADFVIERYLKHRPNAARSVPGLDSESQSNGKALKRYLFQLSRELETADKKRSKEIRGIIDIIDQRLELIKTQDRIKEADYTKEELKEIYKVLSSTPKELEGLGI